MPSSRKSSLELNLQRWSTVHPKEAVFLSYSEDPALHFCHTEKGELNLVRLIGGERYYYHPQEGALEAAERWLDTLSLEGKQVLYLFGLGLGYYYLALKPWLKADRRRSLVILECDLSVIRSFFETEIAKELLRNSQVHLHFFKDLNDQQVFDTIYWNFVQTQMELSVLVLYEQIHHELTVELHHKIVYEASVKNSFVEEYINFGAHFFKNFYANLLYLPDSQLGSRLFGKFRSIPAIICGAGPSIEKHLPLLEQFRDRALIFAGGSSLNVLHNVSLQPHFGAGIDPNPAQLLRIMTSSGFELPFFYRNRLYPQAFRKIHGPHLYVPGSGGYGISDWFESQLGIQLDEELEEGLNVVNFCVELAYQLGCDPIIFVGMDLGYTGMQSYSPGVVPDTCKTREELMHTGDFNRDAVERRDIYGEPFLTEWKWIAESEWIGEYVMAHPSVRFLNATEGGLGMPSVANVRFTECASQWLTQPYDLEGLIHCAIQEAILPQEITVERIKELMVEMEGSLKRAKGHLEILIKETEKVIEQISRDKAVPSVIQSGLAALSEVELASELAYEHILEIFNEVYSRVMSGALREIRLRKRGEVSKTIARLRLNIKKLSFLRDVCRVNLGLIDLARSAYESGDMPETETLQKEFSDYLDVAISSSSNSG